MGYYASGHGSLTLRADVDEDALDDAIAKTGEQGGWEFDLIHPAQLEVAFSDKYRGVPDDLAHLIPFVADGQYIQFTGENDNVWRLRFKDGALIEESATWA